MGCRLVKASEYNYYKYFKRHGDFYRDLEEQRYEKIREHIKQVNKRMESIEKILEVLTNDSRLKDIIEEINKNQNNINKNVPLQQQEDKSTASENEI